MGAEGVLMMTVVIWIFRICVRAPIPFLSSSLVSEYTDGFDYTALRGQMDRARTKESMGFLLNLIA